MLCKIYRKATSLKVLEQRAVEEETKSLQLNNATPLIAEEDQDSFNSQIPRLNSSEMVMKKETSCGEYRAEEEEEVDSKGTETETGTGTGAVGGLLLSSSSSTSKTGLQIPKGFEMLTDLQVPKMNMDWTQDQFWNQFNSPWLLNFTTPSNILNF